MIGQSPAMQEVFSIVHRVAPTTATVLIRGESGTGKELIAKALHYHSPRREHPFVAVHSAALPETCSKASCSAMKRGLSPARSALGTASSRRPTAARCSWMKSGNCHHRCRSSCFASFRKGPSNGWKQPIPTGGRAAGAATHRDLEQAIREGQFRETSTIASTL